MTRRARLLADVDPSWQSDARCLGLDPDLFFPADKHGAAGYEEAAARAVCRRCTVSAQCVAWARTIGATDGIWGGFTAAELRAGRTAPRVA